MFMIVIVSILAWLLRYASQALVAIPAILLELQRILTVTQFTNAHIGDNRTGYELETELLRQPRSSLCAFRVFVHPAG